MDDLGNLIGQAGVWHVVVVLVAVWAIEMRVSVRAAARRRLRHPTPKAGHGMTSARLIRAGSGGRKFRP